MSSCPGICSPDAMRVNVASDLCKPGSARASLSFIESRACCSRALRLTAGPSVTRPWPLGQQPCRERREPPKSPYQHKGLHLQQLCQVEAISPDAGSGWHASLIAYSQLYHSPAGSDSYKPASFAHDCPGQKPHGCQPGIPAQPAACFTKRRAGIMLKVKVRRRGPPLSAVNRQRSLPNTGGRPHACARA